MQSHDDLLKYRTQCVTKFAITEEQLNKYKAWNFEDNEQTRDYIHCIFGKMGLFDDETGFNEDHLLRQLTRNGGDEAETRTAIQACLTENATFEGNSLKAFKGLKCFGSNYSSLIQSSIKKN